MTQSAAPTRALWGFIRRYRAMYAVVGVVLLVSAALETLTVAVLFPVMTAMLSAEDGAAGGRVLRIVDSLTSLVPVRERIVGAVLLLAVVMMVKSAAAWLREWLVARASARVSFDAKRALFERYAQSPYRLFLESAQGDLIYRLTTAPQCLGLALLLVPYIGNELFTILVLTLLLVTIEWRLTLGLMVLGVAFYLVNRFVARQVSFMIGRGRLATAGVELQVASEFVSGVKEIKAGRASGLWLGRFASAAQEFRRLVVRDVVWQTMPGILIELVVFLTAGIVLAVMRVQTGASLVAYVPALGVFAYASQRLLVSVSVVSRHWLRLNAQLADVEAITKALAEPVEEETDGRPAHDVRLTEALTFDRVGFVYPGRDDAALHDVSLSCRRGQVVAFVGASGAGKTTIVNLLLRLFDPTSGRILLDGVDVSTYRRDDWLRTVGYVSQEGFVFSGTVEENIRFGDQAATRADVEDAARRAYAHAFIADLPRGYDTQIGDRGMTLSGGQRQRLAIARAFLRRPTLLVFDEATSALDTSSEALVHRAVWDTAPTCAVILITHRLSSIERADYIYVLDGGRVVAEGRHDELLATPGVYAHLQSVPAAGVR